MSQEVEYPERPISEQLVDLHVYVVPTDLWRDHLNSAINTIINETVSAGFVRVHPESSVYTLREELEGQLGYDIIPREYVFLKSVGRCLTRIRPKQEFQLKIKNFLPPLAYVPEVYLLEASPEYLSSYPSSGAPSGRNSRLDTGPSEFNPHKPMPPIRHSNAGSLQNGNDSLYSTAGTQTGNYPDGPYPQNQQHPNVGPHPNHPYNAHPSQQANTSHGQSHPNTNSYNQPIHSNNGYPNGHNAGGDAPNNRREAYQRQLDDSRTQPGYEPPLSASPPNSAGHTRVGMKKTDSRDPNKYNNTSDDSGISEMDEADRRRAEERLRGQPTSREGDGGTDRRQDLLQLEQRRQEVVDEDRRKKEEEEARWRQWGGAPPGEAGGGGKPGDERGDSGLAGSDRDRRNSNPDENDDALDELLASEDPVDQQELKAKLTEQLEDARAERKDTEKRREDLVKRAKAMQNKTQQRRTQARDLWKKRYFDEKKKTAPLEEQTTRMRQELEALHRKIMSQLEQSKEKDGAGRKGDKPSQQSNLKIQAAKFQHEIEDLQRRVENVKMKLTSEMKLRNQAETELRALRAELTQKKINMSLNRTKVSTQDMSPRESVAQTHR